MCFKGKMIVFVLMAVAIMLSSCTGWRYVFCTSYGILTYNRHTGQLEILWEHQSVPVIPKTDSLNAPVILQTDSVQVVH